MPKTIALSGPMPAFLRIGVLLVCLALLGGCSDLSRTQQRALTGAVIGTATGAATAAVTGGCVSCGAAIGGAVGGASGYLYDLATNNF